MGRKRSEQIPPYISYRSFRNFLAELKARGLPSRIDRSVMAHKSGTLQSQLLIALRFLGLIREQGQPTEYLRALVEGDEKQARSAMAQVLRSSYSFILRDEVGLESATSHQAEELFQRTGASGETVRRCLAFFMAAARYSGLPVSPYIQPHRKKRSARAKRPEPSPAPKSPPDRLPAADSQWLRLSSGGNVSLEFSVNLFELDPKDREFVFGLIDLFREYRQESESKDV